MGFAQVFASPLSVFVDFSTAGEVPIESETINDITYHHVSWPCSKDITPDVAEQRVLSDLRKVLVTS
jgi:hypothetical protein